MIPRKFEQAVFVFLLSGLISCIISFVATFRATGLVDGFFSLWGGAFIASWTVAFPVALLVVPIARRAAKSLIADEL